MKNLVSIVLLLLMSQYGLSQLELPQPSPSSKITQTIGLTEVMIEYSRPSMKGRSVYGHLVPYGQFWRTGANQNTIISFSDSVIVGNKSVKAGTYSLFTKPGEKIWSIVLYDDVNNWGVPRKWEVSKVAAEFEVISKKSPRTTETFTLTFGEITNNSANLNLFWENTLVTIPIAVPTFQKAQASITKVLSGPSPEDFVNAAYYYYTEDLDIEQAKSWIDSAVVKRKISSWYILKARIHSKLGDNKVAIESYNLAQKAAESNYPSDYASNSLEFVQIYCCSNHKPSHCGDPKEIADLAKNKGCKGF